MSESQISAVIAAVHNSLKVNKVRASLVAQMVKNPPAMHPDKDTGVGYHFLLQGIFPNHGSHLGLLQW